MATSTFKSKRRPDAISKIFTLDTHISNTDPHPQYLLRSDVNTDNINITDSFNVNDGAIAAGSNLTYDLNNRLTNHTNNNSIHVSAEDRLKWDNPSFNTNDFVTKTELSSVGIYKTAVNNTGAASYNLNTYTSQGVYYLAPTGSNATLENGPVESSISNSSSGFLTVTSTNTNLMQVLYLENAVYKRTATYASGVWSFGSWQVILANNPIGSILLVTGPVTPAGYLDADGALISKSAYPLLWEYAQTTNYISQGRYSSSDVIANTDKGKYIEISDTDFRVPNLGGEFIRMWTASQTVDTRACNSWQDCGVPNITGRIATRAGSYRNQLQEGALFRSDYGGTKSCEGGGDSVPVGLEFDASRSSNVYNDDLTEVRTRNVALHVCIKAYHGSIVPADASLATIQEIIRNLLDRYGYATEETMGLVRLATLEQARAGQNPQTVITPAILQQVVGVATIVDVPTQRIYSSFTATAGQIGNSTTIYYEKNTDNVYEEVSPNHFKKTTDTSVNTEKKYYNPSFLAQSSSDSYDEGARYYTRSGTSPNYTYTEVENASATNFSTSWFILSDYNYVDEPTGNPATNGYYEYVVAFTAGKTYWTLTATYGMLCTALFDIALVNNNYQDIDLTEYGISASDLDSYSVTPMLVSEDNTNALEYPKNSIVTDPQCAVKPNDQYEELGKLDTTLYVSNTGRPYVRVYWPLMWYLRKFNNYFNGKYVGARLYPLVPATAAQYTSTEFQNNVKTELTKWRLKLKLSKQ